MRNLFIIIIVFLLILILSCGNQQVSEAEIHNSKSPLESQLVSDQSVNKSDSLPVQRPANNPLKIKLPEAEIVFPELSFNKNELPTLKKLENLLIIQAQLHAAFELVYKEKGNREEASEVSMSGTLEDQIRAIMKMTNAAEYWDSYAKEIAKMAIVNFKKHFESNAEFTAKYRETYYAAEEEISGGTMITEDIIIKDDELRRKVRSEFTTGYQPAAYSKHNDMLSLIEEGEELKEYMISTVVNQVEVDMMVADYKKGKELSDVMNGSINKLKIISKIGLHNESIKEMITKVKDKRKSREEEIKKALVEYRFPEQYSGGNAPSNASVLESRMKVFLSKFENRPEENYSIKDINIAGPWIDIHHSLTGAYLYSQIDFFVAVDSDEDDVLDILFVTGKTGGPHKNSFSTYSVGGIGQMLKRNL